MQEVHKFSIIRQDSAGTGGCGLGVVIQWDRLKGVVIQFKGVAIYTVEPRMR